MTNAAYQPRKYETKHTRETGIKIAKFGDNSYRHIDKDNSPVGPYYASKFEAFVDHDNYVKAYMGWK